MAGLLGVDFLDAGVVFLGMGVAFFDVVFFLMGFIFRRNDSGKGKK